MPLINDLLTLFERIVFLFSLDPFASASRVPTSRLAVLYNLVSASFIREILP